MQVSVVICSHNPRRDYLARVLKALQVQSLPFSAWELLLIDNCSTEPLSGYIDLSWHRAARIIREDNVGLSNARARGISESVGETLIFVDDDNVLASDYLEQAVRVALDWPQLGIWGGSAIGEFEVEPPETLRPYLYCLALREVKTQQWSNSWDCQAAEPHGAGLCMRRGVAAGYREFYLRSQLQVGDRSGAALFSGGDSEMAFFVCSLGLGMGVFPELRLTHLIPAARLSEEYITRIAEGLETSSMLLFYKWGKAMPRSPYSPRQLARALKHLLFSRGLQRELVFGRMRAARTARRLIRSATSLRPVGANTFAVREA